MSADVFAGAPSRSGGDVAGQVGAALRLAARALGAPCELGWLDAGGRPTHARAGGPGPPVSWEWLLAGESAIPNGFVALHDGDGKLVGGLTSHGRRDRAPAALDAVAADLAEVLGAVAAGEERLAAHGALLELTSQLHAEELGADELLRLRQIAECARRLIGVDVTWLGLVDDHERVAIAVASGARSRQFVDMWTDAGHGIGGLAVAEGHAVVVPDHRLVQRDSSDRIMRALADEGVVSVICAPLLFEGRALGALYGGSRASTAFGETAVSVFTALAAQAAVSIVNARLYAAVSDENVLLERTLSLHRRLSDAALAGADTHGIAREVARLIDRPLLVARDAGTPRAWRYEPAGDRRPVDAEAEHAAAGEALGGQVEIRAGEERLGTIGALGAAPLSAFDRNALEQGATIMALQIAKERAAWEAEWRLRGELLEEVLQQRGEPSEGLLLRAARFGVDLEAHWRVAVLGPAPEASAELEPVVRAALHRGTCDGRVLVATRGDRVLVALDASGEPAAETIERVLVKASRAGAPAVAGLSSARRELPVALREAEAALRLARDGRPSTLVTYEALGPLRHFLNAPGTAEMSAMVRDALGALAGYDQRRNGELVRTLSAYLRSGGHHATAAAECHIHVSTLKYRLGRIADVLGRPLSDPDARFELTLAFSTLEVLAALGHSSEEIFGIAVPHPGEDRHANFSSRGHVPGRERVKASAPYG